MRTIENDIPEVFLELAREAIGLGISEVNLGFMYMDADFVSPIEWGLWLTKREHGSAPEEYLLLTMGRSEGETEPTAYIPNPEKPLAGTYWGPAEVRSWMRKPLEAESEWIGAWSPVEDPEVQEGHLELWPLFEQGVRSGWTMKYGIQWDRLREVQRMLERTGKASEGGIRVPLKLEWSITNSFYNTEGHADHRSTGAPVSLRGWGSISFGEKQFQEPGRDENCRVRLIPLTEEHVVETLATNHPWFVRVAYNDGEQEGWLHFPEALRAPAQTLDPAKL